MDSDRLSLTLYTEAGTLTGFVSVPRGQRLSDLLNDRSMGEGWEGGAFLDLSGVTSLNEDSPDERYDTLYLAKSALHMVETLDRDTARGIGAKADRRNQLFVHKSPMNVRLQLPNYTLIGTIHCADGETVLDILNAGSMFLPLTDVKIKAKGTDHWRPAAFLAVNSREISSAQEIVAS